MSAFNTLPSWTYHQNTGQNAGQHIDQTINDRFVLFRIRICGQTTRQNAGQTIEQHRIDRIEFLMQSPRLQSKYRSTYWSTG